MIKPIRRERRARRGARGDKWLEFQATPAMDRDGDPAACQGTDPSSAIPAPLELEAETIEIGSLELLVLEYPVGLSAIPEMLTMAEAQVLMLLNQGLSAKLIANKRGVSVRTIDHQLGSIYRKLGVNTREELIVKLLALPSS